MTDAFPNSELITIPSIVTGTAGWQPIEGEELNTLLERLARGDELPSTEIEKVRGETIQILSRCVDPRGMQSTNTGLVIGRIQSGKTMSFTALAAAARDNAFDIIIVMGGITTILIEQTRDRLYRDLGANEGTAFLRWDIYESMLSDSERDRLRAVLAASSTSTKPTVLLTLMKHHGHINNLADALETVDLSEASALIVDDEADQHSLNTAIARNDASATYRSITRLRSLFPRHTFLQYTATPQAPLLVDLADVLSPDWTALLTPGRGYVGGASYFHDYRDDLIRRIPEPEAMAVEQGATDPPDSLLKALYTFLLSFAAGHPAYGPGGPTTRSMMVHPHTQIWTHELVMRWIREILGRVRFQLQAPRESPEQQELLSDLEPAHADLSSTVPNLPSLEELIDRLAERINELRLQEVNSAQEAVGQALRWNQAYGWILVGGEMLNRGFTVKGLVVTYMPRGAGVGNADTLAQRARFFGYRSSYLDHCRVYLRGSLIDAYTKLVDTEERVRADLEAHMAEEGTLKTWKRKFLLDPRLRPTRRSVIAVGLVRTHLGEWFDQRFPAMSDRDAEWNRQLAATFLDSLPLKDMPHDGDWGNNQNHQTAIVPLATAAEQLLVDWKAIAGDRKDYEAVVLAISEILATEPDATAEVVVIDGPRRRRATETDADGNPKIALMQGRSAETADLTYPGDRNLPRDDRAAVSIQIHIVDVSYDDVDQGGGYVPQDRLPLLAIRVRDGVNSWLAQID